jgi:urease gamma subunit
MSVTFALQRSLSNRLTAHLACTVYDGVPDGAPLPLVLIGEDVCTIKRVANTAKRFEILHTIHVFVGGRSMMPLKLLMAEITAAIDDEVLDLAGDGYAVTSQLVESETALVDDKDARHGVMQLRALIKPIQ